MRSGELALHARAAVGPAHATYTGHSGYCLGNPVANFFIEQLSTAEHGMARDPSL
jgi:hypothetical protein